MGIVAEVEVEEEKRKSISGTYFGYLVGRTREILEASIADDRQLKALTRITVNTLYDWWEGADVPNHGNNV